MARAFSSEERDELEISLLEHAAEYGGWHVVDYMLSEERMKRIVSTGSNPRLPSIESIQNRLMQAKEEEKIHGEGSILDHAHPFVKEMKRLASANKDLESGKYLRRYREAR